MLSNQVNYRGKKMLAELQCTVWSAPWFFGALVIRTFNLLLTVSTVLLFANAINPFQLSFIYIYSIKSHPKLFHFAQRKTNSPTGTCKVQQTVLQWRNLAQTQNLEDRRLPVTIWDETKISKLSHYRFRYLKINILNLEIQKDSCFFYLV